MKIKKIITSILLWQLSIASISVSSIVNAQSAIESTKEEVEKGPNNGRMLRDGDFAIELAIFEDGMPPEFRIFATKGDTKLSAADIEVNVQLLRLGDVVDDINFYVEKSYLRGDMEIFEPHSFQVQLTARYAGKTHQWSYDNFEGRVAIEKKIADAMQIETEAVVSQVFDETLKVFGKLKIAPNAIRHVSARFPGEIKRFHAVLGQRVKKGQLLMTIEGNESLQTYKVYAPMSGLVTAQNAGTGEQTNDRRLLTISDTSKLIAELGVYPMDQAKVKLGSLVNISITGSDKVIKTQLFDALFDVNNEQAKLFRAEIDNTNGSLKAGQFISAEILLDSYKVPMAVKATALQSFRDFTVVYAKVDEQYEVRMLDLGRKVGPWVEVLGGIAAGTEYVAKNSYIIKADIDKSGASHDH
ncbi:secretion protein HlyD [Pseudoalteromonas sp. NBT06-2]|uniref:efflux RND transporter periplasmic adaptor subunit n=1 Tax=Pseudoalteromonas sp. NBT06-2 TaxID=2025950 RepID=UPI000BA6D391|nr:efflux RND transporter periplasmic adaptor subunit [Pseudoalteromonas sp. NBT06-2]PAJ72363.1 secretion protein HlyD [Pseudoalteromonas sp. NBT06-2]